MCGSCDGASHAGRKRWTSSHLIVIVLIGTLATLSVAGLVLRRGGRSESTASGCSHLVVDSTAYQAAVTRHYGDGSATLMNDTSDFVDHVRAEGEASCTAFRALMTDSRTTLATVCGPCVTQLAGAFTTRHALALAHPVDSKPR